MNVWVVNAIIIEFMALIGVVGVLATHRTHIAFASGFNTMFLVTGVFILSSPPFHFRQLIILGMVIAYLIHMNWLLWFHGRHTAITKLDIHLPPSQKYFLPILLTNVAGWGYCLPLYFAAKNHSPLGAMDGLAVLVYIVGFVIHYGSDYQKLRFKRSEGSRGKLLTSGFWALCRHPNYFGDFLIYVAFALIGGRLLGWISPLLNFTQYLFDAIPKSEQWARERYGEQWEEYTKRVKKFIPFVY